MKKNFPCKAALHLAPPNYVVLIWRPACRSKKRAWQGAAPAGRPRRTFPGTSQGVSRGPATPLGEVTWNGSSKYDAERSVVKRRLELPDFLEKT